MSNKRFGVCPFIKNRWRRKMSRQKKNPLLSVIIPVYNTKKYLYECLTSVINQTYSNLDIIIVDDGSTDGSQDICDAFLEKDNRIRVIHKKNEGLVSARKTGIVAAKGEYISYVDSDDWIDKNRYFEMYKKGMRIDADMISGNIVNEYNNGSNLIIKDVCGEGCFIGNKLDYIVDNIVDLEKFYIPKQHLSLCKYVFKKNILFEIQMSIDNSITVGEDDVTTIQCLTKIESLVSIDGANYHYRKHSESMMHRHDINEKKRLKLIYETISKHCSLYKNYERLMRQLDLMMYMELLTSDYEALMENEVNLFPYGIEKRKKIVIYGAGSLGCEIVKFVNKCSDWIIEGWCDGNSDAYGEYMEKYGVPVCSPKVIRNFNYDYIIIAITNYSVVMGILEELLEMGVKKSSIKYIDKTTCLSRRKLENIF